MILTVPPTVKSQQNAAYFCTATAGGTTRQCYLCDEWLRRKMITIYLILVFYCSIFKNFDTKY